MLDQLTQLLAHPLSIVALIAWAEIRLMPLGRKILARSEEASANSRALCEKAGIKSMTDAEGDELARRELGPMIVSEEEGARIMKGLFGRATHGGPLGGLGTFAAEPSPAPPPSSAATPPA